MCTIGDAESYGCANLVEYPAYESRLPIGHWRIGYDRKNILFTFLVLARTFLVSVWDLPLAQISNKILVRDSNSIKKGAYVTG